MSTKELLRLHVDEISTNGNVRRKVDVKNLLPSVTAKGVLVPLLVRQNDAGWQLVAGARRLTAAREASKKNPERAYVPAVEVEADDDGAFVMAQLIENLNRQDLDGVDTADAFEQLALLGFAEAAISESTGTPVDVVKAARSVAGSKKAKAALRKHELTITQAAAIAEFEDDPAALKRLLSTAETSPDYFDHDLARLREDRAAAEAQQAAIDKLTATGVTVVPPSENWRDDMSKPVQLTRLEGVGGKSLTVAGHKKCPGHAAFVLQPYRGKPETVYVCAEPEKCGHKLLRSAVSSRPSETPKQRADRLAAARAWRAATKVRLEFVRSLLGRKRTPANTLRFAVAETVGQSREPHQIDKMLCELLGVTPSTRPYEHFGVKELQKRARDAGSDAAAAISLLAEVCARYEWLLSRAAADDAGTKRYLQFLASCRYTLSEAEAAAAKKAKR